MSCQSKYEDEPSFTLVGRDLAAVAALTAWIARAKSLGAPEEKLDRAIEDLGLFQKFAQQNPDKMKVPD